MLKVKRFIFNNFEENTYIAFDSETKQGAIIDPGMLLGHERKAIDDFIAENGIKLNQIILTHAHLDHCFGVEYVKTHYGTPIKAHEKDAPLVSALNSQAMRFGMINLFQKGFDVDIKLNEGDEVKIGDSCLTVLHLPGHSPGGMVLYDKADKLAFVGDSIFESSIGRTDLEGGDYKTLINSLKTKVLTLPDDTILLSGHGEPTTVAREKKYNPYLV